MVPDADSAEASYRRMLSIGDQLNAELRREIALSNRVRMDSEHADTLEEWKSCRLMVELLAAQYVQAINSYRTAMTQAMESAERPGKRVND